MGDERSAHQRCEKAGVPRGERPGEGPSFGAPAEYGGDGAQGTTGAAGAAGTTTVRGASAPSGDGRGAGDGRARLPQTGYSVPLCASNFVGDDAPACVRQLEAQPAWAELRPSGQETAEALRDALASLERIEGLIARLGSSVAGDVSFQMRLAEGLVHSLRDVLGECAGEVDVAARGAWRVLLLRPRGAPPNG